MLAVCVGVVGLFAAALPIFIGSVSGHRGEPALGPSSLTDFLRAPAQLTGEAVLLVGLLTAAAEFRHRTILTARLAEPRTTRLLTAKLITVAAIGFVVGLAMEIVATGVGAIVLAQHHVAIEPLAHGVPRLAVVLPAVIALQGISASRSERCCVTPRRRSGPRWCGPSSSKASCQSSPASHT